MTVEEMVKEFHVVFGVSISNTKDEYAVDQRINLNKEECRELEEAIRSGNPEEILKECCDLVYVAVGTAVRFGMNFDEAFKRVHESNMTKIWPDGTVHYREDGKVLKPETYKAPYLGDLV